ncbi:unnamed protein product [Durusdinium trenchii]|uniref:Uncharacterized protein n=1 Tax=Durusdinium trenchii TaxID=1381693 RepID=A0ABP0IRB8_9DINO
MFSTSVLERRTSLDPQMESEAGRRVALFDKENRPNLANIQSKEANKAKDVGEWWLQQRRDQQSLWEKGEAKLKKRCEELENERQAQAEKLLELEERLKWEEEQRKAQAQRLQLVLRGSEAVEKLACLQKLHEQMRLLKERTTQHEEKLQAFTKERPAGEANDSPRLATSMEAVGEVEKLKQELQQIKAELAEAQAEAEVRKKCSREVQEELQRDCDSWQRHARTLELATAGAGCCSCERLFAEGRELSATVAMLQDQCETLEVENQSLKGKVESLQENLEYVSSSHAELAGHVNHRLAVQGAQHANDKRN